MQQFISQCIEQLQTGTSLLRSGVQSLALQLFPNDMEDIRLHVPAEVMFVPLTTIGCVPEAIPECIKETVAI